MSLPHLVCWCLLAAALAHVLLSAVALVICLAGTAFARRREEREMEEDEAVAAPRLALPATVIAVSRPRRPTTREAISSLLAFTHSPLEVIVVVDATATNEIERLRSEFAPETWRRLPKSPARPESVRAIHRSHDHRLVLVEAATSNRADALNCGLGLARHTYVCCVDADASYRPDALTRAMTLAARDPSTVVGVLGYLTPELAVRGAFRHIDEARARLNDRVCWGRRAVLPCRTGTFALWRRDVLEDEGGFRIDIAHPILEMTTRALQRGRVLRVPGSVGKRDVHPLPEVAAMERSRWRRAVRRVLLRQGRRLIFPALDTLAETTGPLFEAIGIMALAILAATGALRPVATVAAVSLLVFPPAVLTVFALLLQDIQQRAHTWKRLSWLALLSPIEALIHRPRVAVALWMAALRPQRFTH